MNEKTRALRWLPFALVVAAQVAIVANLTMIDISIGAIVRDFATATTSVQTAIVACSLVTAAMMILAGRIAIARGSLPMFRGGLVLLVVAMAGVAASPGTATLIAAEALAGAATAALMPTLVALVRENYQGHEQSLAIGALGVAGGAIALLLAGVLGTAVGWRVPFGVVAVLAALALIASLRLRPSPKQAGVLKIDWLGLLFSAGGILLLTVGVNAIGACGLVQAKSTAPVDLFGLSPALPLIVAGILLIWAFFAYQRRRARRGGAPLLSPEVAAAPRARRASAGLLITFAVSGGSWYLLVLYMQIVQGYSGRQTAVAMLPYALTVTASALLVTRLVGHFKLAVLARGSMLMMTIGLLTLGVAINNSWGDATVILGLFVLGLGQGAILTIVSNVLIGASRPALAGEAGALRGTVCNLGSAIGTAIAGALLITLLSVHVQSGVTSSTALPPQLKSGLKLENVQFISNEQLEQEATKAGLTPAEVADVVQINTQARLTALQQALFSLAVLAALGVLLVGGLREPRRPEREDRRKASRVRGSLVRVGNRDSHTTGPGVCRAH